MERTGGIARRILGLGLSCALLAVGPLACATAQAKREAAKDLERARSHFDIGVDHLREGRVELALRELMISDELNPRHPDTNQALGEAYLQKGLFADAERHLRRTLEIAPDAHDARLHLSALLIDRERFEEAIAESRILLEDPTFPAPWRAHTNLGWAAFRIGRNAEARRHLEQAVAFHERYWPALLDLGILEAQEGHRLEAIEHFRRTLDLEPGPGAEAEANYRLAEIFVSLGKRERAVGHLMAAVARTPGGPWGKKSEEYLKLLR